jgi:hypothetical protein
VIEGLIARSATRQANGNHGRIAAKKERGFYASRESGASFSAACVGL